MIAIIETRHFKQYVLESGHPVLVDFWASWCENCRAQLLILDDIAEDLGRSARIGKVNIDSESSLAYLFQIRAVPTLLLFKNGKIVQRFQGFTRKQDLIDALNKHII